MRKYRVHFAITRGCQVNLRDQAGRFISKGWKFMSTSYHVAQRMDLPCTCKKETTHVSCEGSLTRQTAFYTPEFARRVCETILQGDAPQEIRKELEGCFEGCDLFGRGLMCVCEDGKRHDANLQCGSCRSDLTGILAADEEVPCSLTKDQIHKKLYLLHSATGHSPTKYLVQALRRRGVHKKIIEEAERFTCAVCAERARPQPRNVAALEPQPPKFATLSADVGNFIQPNTGEHVQFVLFVDEGSRFRVARIVTKGKKQHPSAAQFITVLKEAWISYFGTPLNLRLDPDGAFRSRELLEYCDQHQIFLDIIPGEGHWKLGTCERSIQAIKELLYKVCSDMPDISMEDALSECVRVLNNREVVRGYSPIQHVLGRAPDDTGRFFTPDTANSPDLLSETPAQEHQRIAELRLAAEKAFLDWNNNQRLSRARNSKHHRLLDFTAGDLVYIWRKQVTGKDAQPVKSTHGKFVGPARILATENRRDDQGHLIAGSSVWLVRGRRLLKCCPEQLRHASEREKILDELHSEESQPWSFPRVAEELGGNDYEDWSEHPEESEWQRAGDPRHEWQPHVRQRGKRPMPPDYEVDVCPEGSASSRLRRSDDFHEAPDENMLAQSLIPPCGFQSGTTWIQQVKETAFLTEEEESFWQQETAAVSIEIDMPQTRGASERAFKNLSAFLVSAMKRKTIEVSEKRMTPEERIAFQKAKAVEVSNFIAAKAFEALPKGYRARREDAVRMR